MTDAPASTILDNIRALFQMVEDAELARRARGPQAIVVRVDVAPRIEAQLRAAGFDEHDVVVIPSPLPDTGTAYVMSPELYRATRPLPRPKVSLIKVTAP